MQKKPKGSEDSDEDKEDEQDPCEEEQKRGSYYYDDAHGYEKYDPDNEDREED